MHSLQLRALRTWQGGLTRGKVCKLCKLCKRYLFLLDTIVKVRVNPKKKPEGPPKMLYLRELFSACWPA